MQHYRLKEPIPADVVHTRSPSFLKVNPNGHVPTMEDDGLMGMWSLWAATEVEPHSLSVAQNGPSASVIDALRGPFAVLDEALADGFLVGGRFTVADVNVAEVVRYAEGATELFKVAPKVKAWFDACQARPAYRKMWAAREKEPA